MSDFFLRTNSDLHDDSHPLRLTCEGEEVENLEIQRVLFVWKYAEQYEMTKSTVLLTKALRKEAVKCQSMWTRMCICS